MANLMLASVTHLENFGVAKEPLVPDRLILSSDSHVFEPPDLWTQRIDDAFKSRAPRMKRVGDVDHLVVEDGQMIAGIGLISNAGARYEAPETISDHARFEDVHEGGYDPAQHLKDMVIDGVCGEVPRSLPPTAPYVTLTLRRKELR